MFLIFYFKRNRQQSGYRKRRIEIWTKSTRFNTKSQRVAHQTIILKKKNSFVT